MKRITFALGSLLLSSSALLAADIYTPPEAEATPAWTWSGLYVGGTGGYAFGDKGEFSLHDYPDIKVDHDYSGFVAGGMLGGNYQLGTMFVVGAELDGFWANIEGSQTIDDHFDTHSSIDALVLGKGKLGLTWDRAMLYVTGGYAGADLNGDVSYKQGVGKSLGNQTKIFDANQWANGFVVGGGVDIALTQNWFAGIEYNHIRFTDVKLSDNIENWKVNVDSNIDIDQVVGRLGFRF